jgi:hypothetical protein
MHKKLLSVFIFILLATRAPVLWAQGSAATQNLTAQASTCSAPTNTTACLFLPVGNTTGTIVATLSGTFSGTVQFEATGDNVTWTSISAAPGSGASVTSATGTGNWQIQAQGYLYVRIRCSTYSSGTIVATLNPSKAATASTGSGSGGTGAGFATGTDTGAANAYVVALTPAWNSYNISNGLACFTAVNANNSSTVTINFGPGTKNVVRFNGTNLNAAGDISTSEPGCYIYDGTNLLMLNPQQIAGTGGAIILGNQPNFATNVSLNSGKWESQTVPTAATGGGCGTTPAVASNPGTPGFRLTIGSSTNTPPCVLTFPAASTGGGWSVQCTDNTTTSTSNFITKCVPTSTTAVSCTPYSDVAAASTWTAGDVLSCMASAN